MVSCDYACCRKSGLYPTHRSVVHTQLSQKSFSSQKLHEPNEANEHVSGLLHRNGSYLNSFSSKAQLYAVNAYFFAYETCGSMEKRRRGLKKWCSHGANVICNHLTYIWMACMGDSATKYHSLACGCVTTAAIINAFDFC